MFRRFLPLPACVALTLAVLSAATRADEPVRGILVKPARVAPEILAAWKAKGATALVVPLDERSKPRWDLVAKSAELAGMTLWPWIEVARNPELADAHPDWMAAIGGHHGDWRTRFPNAPRTKPGEVIKAWPWVPIGYAPALDAHRERLKTLLAGLPGSWSGVFVTDLQAGPSSCGCGNDQCRWALDYGSAPTAARTPGDDAAARIVADLRVRHPGKTIVPVWVTECELADLRGARGGTGHCGTVACATADCWPRYVRSWNPLLKATEGPIAVALWTEAFRRDPAHWIEPAIALFQAPPRGDPLAPARTIAVVGAWNQPAEAVNALPDRIKPVAAGWVIALDPIDQSWEPKAVPAPGL